MSAEVDLKFWRRKLETKPEEAKQDAIKTCEMLVQKHPTLTYHGFTKAYYQMMNGVNCPADYTETRVA